MRRQLSNGEEDSFLYLPAGSDLQLFIQLRFRLAFGCTARRSRQHRCTPHDGHTGDQSGGAAWVCQAGPQVRHSTAGAGASFPRLSVAARRRTRSTTRTRRGFPRASTRPRPSPGSRPNPSSSSGPGSSASASARRSTCGRCRRSRLRCATHLVAAYGRCCGSGTSGGGGWLGAGGWQAVPGLGKTL